MVRIDTLRQTLASQKQTQRKYAEAVSHLNKDNGLTNHISPLLFACDLISNISTPPVRLRFNFKYQHPSCSLANRRGSRCRDHGIRRGGRLLGESPMFVLSHQPPQSSLSRSTFPSYPQAAGGVLNCFKNYILLLFASEQKGVLSTSHTQLLI